MSHSELKQATWEANMERHHRGLVLYTWGNVSQIDRAAGVFAIKPSGVPYEKLTPDDIVVVDLENNVIEGKLNPSSDTRTHTHWYKNFEKIGGVTHPHSTYATAWAQAQQPIPCFGTTHADDAYGEIPCTAIMSNEQIERDYEEETGVQITDVFADRSPRETPMVIVAGHAPFTWGKDAAESVYHAVVLEELASIAYMTIAIDPARCALKQEIVDKHYLLIHCKGAYYGQ